MNLYRHVPLKTRAQTVPGVMTAGVTLNGLANGHGGWDQTYGNSASSLALGSFDLDAMTSP